MTHRDIDQVDIEITNIVAAIRDGDLESQRAFRDTVMPILHPSLGRFAASYLRRNGCPAQFVEDAATDVVHAIFDPGSETGRKAIANARQAVPHAAETGEKGRHVILRHLMSTVKDACYDALNRRAGLARRRRSRDQETPLMQPLMAEHEEGLADHRQPLEKIDTKELTDRIVARLSLDSNDWLLTSFRLDGLMFGEIAELFRDLDNARLSQEHQVRRRWLEITKREAEALEGKTDSGA